MTQSTIYHLVTESEFRVQVREDAYIPARFDQDGFIHCAGEADTLLAVANDYFSSAEEPVLVLVIETAKLTAKVRFEPPAPVEGGGTSHLEKNLLFPHIYGPLNMNAVTEIGTLRKSGNKYLWPGHFTATEVYRQQEQEITS